MLFELIAVVTAGFAMGGVVMLVRRVVPACPRWMIPVAAGAAMIATSVSLEYSWYDRTAAALPEGVQVAMSHENTAPWRPWTYVFPYVDRFIAVDRAGIRTNAEAETQVMTSLYVFGRWAPTRRVRTVFDCADGRRADLLSDDTLSADGTVAPAAWIDTGLNDPVTQTACSGL